jgi:hypothetical protein
MKKSKFIDSHVHGCLKPSDENRFKTVISALVRNGLEKIVIAVLPFHDFDYHLKLSLTPDTIQPAIGKDNHDETILLTEWTRKHEFSHVVVPFLDVRFQTENIREKLVSCKQSGFMGIKGAFIPDPDTVLNIESIPHALGISRDTYCDIQLEIFRCAYELNLPLLYHVNLSQHYDWLTSILKRFPLVKVSIPHLGYSLKRITNLLGQFENTYTDPAFLISLLRKNNPRYLNFFENYHTRIMSGSDAVIISSSLEEIMSYPHYFSHLQMPDQVKRAILRENAHTFFSSGT